MSWNIYPTKQNVSIFGFHRNPSKLQTSVILLWQKPIKRAAEFLETNSPNEYMGIFAFVVKRSSFCQITISSWCQPILDLLILLELPLLFHSHPSLKQLTNLGELAAWFSHCLQSVWFWSQVVKKKTMSASFNAININYTWAPFT